MFCRVALDPTDLRKAVNEVSILGRPGLHITGCERIAQQSTMVKKRQTAKLGIEQQTKRESVQGADHLCLAKPHT
jgi:hypothetical protein